MVLESCRSLYTPTGHAQRILRGRQALLAKAKPRTPIKALKYDLRFITAKEYLMKIEKLTGKRFGSIVAFRKRQGIHEYLIRWDRFSSVHWYRTPRLQRRRFWMRMKGKVV